MYIITEDHKYRVSKVVGCIDGWFIVTVDRSFFFTTQRTEDVREVTFQTRNKSYRLDDIVEMVVVLDKVT